jgi:hypothetical protein
LAQKEQVPLFLRLVSERLELIETSLKGIPQNGSRTNAFIGLGLISATPDMTST